MGDAAAQLDGGAVLRGALARRLGMPGSGGEVGQTPAQLARRPHLGRPPSRAGARWLVRLSMAFGTSAESWMNQQTQYDLWHAERRRKEFKVTRVAA